MKRIVGLHATFGALSILVSPAFARVATIETAVPLADDSEPAMDAAVAEAVSTVVRGAQAMGLTHIELTRAAIAESAVVIRILATDTPATGEPEPGAPASPDGSPLPSSDDASSQLEVRRDSDGRGN